MWWCSNAHIAPWFLLPPTPPPPLHLPPPVIFQVGIQLKNRLKDDNVALSLPSQVCMSVCVRVGMFLSISGTQPSSGMCCKRPGPALPGVWVGVCWDQATTFLSVIRTLLSSRGLQGLSPCTPMRCSGLVGGQLRPAACVAPMPHTTSCPTAMPAAARGPL